MMMNLFSSFDPSSNWHLSLNWLSTFIGLMILPSTYWLIPSRLSMVWMKIIIILHKELNTIIKNKGMTIMFISIFSLFLFNNFVGLFPFIFTSSSHGVMNLSIALPIWVTFMMFGWINNTVHMLAHLVPSGTPKILMPFMVCIESISNLIRPITLTIRLSANMIAGHLLLTLLGNTGNMLSSMIPILLMIQILLLILESAVAMIQSYVFAVLTTLYSSEIN